MEPRNFKEEYFLGTQPLLDPAGRDPPAQGIYDALERTLAVETHGPGFHVGRLVSRHAVRLGRERSIRISPDNTRMLVLSTAIHGFFGPRMRKIAGLGYSLSNETEDATIVAEYVQTFHNISHERFNEARAVLGTHPYEFLVAHFLHRLAPVLGDDPARHVRMLFAIAESPGNAALAHPGLRDRFLSRSLYLNPEKERVRQILGEYNPWLVHPARERTKHLPSPISRARGQRDVERHQRETFK